MKVTTCFLHWNPDSRFHRRTSGTCRTRKSSGQYSQFSLARIAASKRSPIHWAHCGTTAFPNRPRRFVRSFIASSKSLSMSDLVPSANLRSGDSSAASPDPSTSVVAGCSRLSLLAPCPAWLPCLPTAWGSDGASQGKSRMIAGHRGSAGPGAKTGRPSAPQSRLVDARSGSSSHRWPDLTSNPARLASGTSAPVGPIPVRPCGPRRDS